MNYKDLYKDILKQISGDICTRWPESGFSHATWADLAANCTRVYKALADKKNSVPQSVCLGRYAIKSADGEKVTLPYSWDWCKYRGIVLSPDAKYGEDVSNDLLAGIRRIAAAFLLRLSAQTTEHQLIVHKVDLNSDGGLELVPHSQKTPIINDSSKLSQLIADVKDIIANHSTGFEWRCDGYSGMNPLPLRIALIANWDSLSRRESDGAVKSSEAQEEIRKQFSEVQEEIRKLIGSEVAAKNGIYFVICASNTVGLEGLTQVRISQDNDQFSGVMTPVIPDKKDANPVSKETLSPVELLFPLPSDAEVQAIHQAKQKRDSGALEDDEVDGLWAGNSAKGLRAIMGATPQGNNDQYFELSTGKGSQAHHALIGGKTGTGKSVLLSEIICSLAERYSPEEFKLILLDYKGGTEFYPFKDLPHVFALSAAMNAEFGTAALEWLCKEREKRDDLFKKANVNNIAEYRKATGEKLCRFLVIADEFQMLCNDKKHGDKAKQYINTLARLGRSFGMHLILSTQTLKDGALDGEAKEQFGCRICLALSESDSTLFLTSGNNIPAQFTQAGQAVLNYQGGEKEGNILFRSGNKAFPKGNGTAFRNREDILRCISDMRTKAIAEGLMPEKQYIYNGDNFASLSTDLVAPDKGFILGLKNNMEADPYYLSNRHIDRGVIIIGSDEEKVKHLLQTISAQTSAIYGTHCPVMSTEEYLDRPQDYPLTIIRADEGDMNLEYVIEKWQESRKRQEATPASAPVQTAVPAYQAPERMESEFAELLAGMHFNFTDSGTSSVSSRSTRKRKTLPLIIALPTHADVKMMDAFGLSRYDFCVNIYADVQSYNALSNGDNERGTLPVSQIMVEYPQGVINKICVGRIN